jgi:hypothetical protein
VHGEPTEGTGRPRGQAGRIAAMAAAAMLGLANPGVGAPAGISLVEWPGHPAARVEIVLPYPAGQEVLAHYTEHLAWLNAMGAKARDADRHSNAWTNAYAVGYWLSGAPEDLPELLRALSGVFDPLELPRDFAAEERGILLREYDHRMADNPDAKADAALDAFLYAGNRMAASPIGTPAAIGALDYDAARALHAETHRPGNARLVVIGDITPRQVRRAMRQAGWPRATGDGAATLPPAFDPAAPDRIVLRDPEPDAAPRLIWRKVVTLPEPMPFDLLEAQAALLGDILFSNLPGGLAGPLRFDAAIASRFDVDVWPIDEDTIEIGFRASPDRGVSLATLQAAFEAALAATAAAGIPEDTHRRALDRVDFWPDWDDPEDTAAWRAAYVLDRVSRLREPLSERALKRLDRGLSRETTNALLRRLAGAGRTAIAFIGPEDSFE